MGLVPRGVADLKARLDCYSSDPGLLISPFLSRSTRERLRAENLNFLDFTGNVRLVLARPGLYVETQGAEQDPSPKRQPGRSLRGAKAARIVRALCDFPPPLPISDVAAQAKVDISYASRLVEWLSREALVERRPFAWVVTPTRIEVHKHLRLEMPLRARREWPRLAPAPKCLQNSGRIRRTGDCCRTCESGKPLELEPLEPEVARHHQVERRGERVRIPASPPTFAHPVNG